ncbi:MAG: DUF1614 domain-containing protein [Desulfosalsimonadaceae bacterium]
MPYGCLPLAAFFGLLILLPLFLADIMITALSRLGLSPEASLLAALGIFLGGMINIPVRRLRRTQVLESNVFGMFGFERMFPGRVRRAPYTVIAVNFGGCVVPVIITAYELIRISTFGLYNLVLTLVAVAINVFACYHLARPIPRVGIAMPALVPGFLAAICAILFHHELAPMTAFCAGVLGPLIGADLLHLHEIKSINTGTASIGGAGTFDGIVISGLLATLLAY